jgi:colanic acid biosynthesis glycosyl transferase WcaI
MARVVFLNRFYWPDEVATAQLLTDLAERLVVRGHEVVVITSRPNRPDIAREETHHGVRIIRVRVSRAKGTGVVAKAVDYATYFATALWRLWREASRDTIVVALTDPPLLGIAAWLAGRAGGARIVHWAQDVYPELAISLSGHSWLRVFRPLRDLAWRRADRCVAISNGIAGKFLTAGVPASHITVIENWSPLAGAEPDAADVAALKAAWHLEAKFVVAYSGNFGRVHDLDSVIALARAMQPDSTIAFLLIGDGAQRSVIAAAASGLPNVMLQPPQPRARLAAALAVADAHLVTLRAGCENLVFPSKLYGIAAIGRPVIFIGPPGCEVAEVVRQNQIGYAGSPGQIAELAAEIRRLAAEPEARARLSAAGQRFGASRTADTAAAKWETLLEGLRTC